MQGKRLERVNQLIKEEISMLLQRELKDPRLGFVTVTEVDVTADLKQAKVYVSVLGPEEKWVSSFQALESARGFIWNWLRRRFEISVAEVDHHDSWQRATLALACVSGDSRHANEVISKAMDFVEEHVDGYVTDIHVEIF